MTDFEPLPDDFLQGLAELERLYLQEDDPIRQSGFSGGPERWRAERIPILEPVDKDGPFLDVGCANGYLLECLVRWAKERGIDLVPFGLDQGSALVDLARLRHPGIESNFFVGNAWNWTPPMHFHYVYTLYDCVPVSYLGKYVTRLASQFVAPAGRLIIGAYGSRSDAISPFDIAEFLNEKGFQVAGEALGGDPAVTAFAWIDP